MKHASVSSTVHGGGSGGAFLWPRRGSVARETINHLAFIVHHDDGRVRVWRIRQARLLKTIEYSAGCYDRGDFIGKLRSRWVTDHHVIRIDYGKIVTWHLPRMRGASSKTREPRLPRSCRGSSF